MYPCPALDPLLMGIEPEDMGMVVGMEPEDMGMVVDMEPEDTGMVVGMEPLLMEDMELAFGASPHTVADLNVPVNAACVSSNNVPTISLGG